MPEVPTDRTASQNPRESRPTGPHPDDPGTPQAHPPHRDAAAAGQNPAEAVQQQQAWQTPQYAPAQPGQAASPQGAVGAAPFPTPQATAAGTWQQPAPVRRGAQTARRTANASETSPAATRAQGTRRRHGGPGGFGPGSPGGPSGPRIPGDPGQDGSGRISLPRWLFFSLIGLILVLLVLCVALGVRACSTPSEPEESEPAGWVSPYDWDNLTTQDNGLLAYYKDGRLASEAGVDVSEHDGAIDWQAVKASGVDFAMIRLGYRGYGSGDIVLDSYFLANISGAAEAGLKVGVYFFSQAITTEEAQEEAQYVIDTLSSLNVTLDYPVVFDQEPITNGDPARTDGISDQQLTDNALAFCQAIEAAGYTPMIYGNQHDLAKLDLDGVLAAYDVWLAEYEVDTPTAELDFVMWQYTEHGTVDGIPSTEGWTDLNIRFLEQ